MEFRPWPGTNTYLDTVAILMLPLLVLHYIMVLTQHPISHLHPPPLHSTPTCLTPTPISYRLPQGHPPTWTSPGSCYLESLLSGSLVSLTAPPLSSTVVSPFIPQISCIAPLYRCSQPLTHAPLISHLLLNLLG